MNRRLGVLLGAALVLPVVFAAPPAGSYPLDGVERTGIRRLTGYSNAHGAPGGAKLPAGALLGTEDVHLQLADAGSGWDLAGVPRDPALQAALDSIFTARDPSYAVAVVDITDPDAIVWAGRREDVTQAPGSVGKILCLVALFDGLRRAFPDPDQRLRVLRETEVEAGDWVLVDEHKVPSFDPATGRNQFSIIQPGERFRLSEWVDHMVSASANAAGATVWKEAILLRHFGSAYPPTRADEAAFFRNTPKLELQRLSQIVIDEPLAAAGIDLDKIQQGSMWTRTGKAHIPGLPSFASPRELVRILLRLEQGRLVDSWSSLEVKRFLYMTRRRYRYVFAPELAGAAVYFKSGSLYQCKPEEGFRCGKYRGNAKNYMNSVVIMETPASSGVGQKRYLVALLSNVLRVNSAWDHARIGAAIDEAVRTRRATVVRDQGSEAQQIEAGRGD